MYDIKMRLTGFFLTFNGIVIAGLLVLLKGEAKVKILDQPQTLIAILSFVIALVGIPVVRILASLRREQIQRYRIMNNIRTRFLQRDYDLWNAVALSERTLPEPHHKTGNYGWLLLVMLISSSVFALSSHLFVV